MDLENDSNYLNNYQHNHFQESSNDLYKTADVRRKCLVQTFQACHNIETENAISNIIEKKLKEYSEFVDNKSSINNYASTIENITSTIHKSHCLQWKNELKVEMYSDLIKSLQCCSENQISKQEFELFFQKKSIGILHKKSNYYIPKNNNTKTNDIAELPQTQNSTYKNVPIVQQISSSSTKYQNTKYKVQNKISVEDNGTQTAKRNNCGVFKTARDELDTQNVKKYSSKQQNTGHQQSLFSCGGQKKSLGARRGVQSKFVPPVRTDSENSTNSPDFDSEEVVDERLKNIDPRMVELIRSEIMDSSASITWDDISGLEFAKTIIKEVVVWPLLRPDIFTGLRRPPKGILLFGPPGTGKTLIGKCIASQSQSTFFSISASSLTSKWIGDGEKMVRAMFAVARCHQPAVIFIDEIDSLLSQRSDTEHESSRRIKTEFLVQLDGAATGEEDRILVIGATNRPQELDEAARRRFIKRLYIPLPEKLARLEIVKRLMSNERHELSEENILKIAELSNGYSGADMKSLCAEASLGPIRAIDISMIHNIQADQVRHIEMQDFSLALNRVKASVSAGDLKQYISWNQTYGAGGW